MLEAWEINSRREQRKTKMAFGRIQAREQHPLPLEPEQDPTKKNAGGAN
jgi:hypothetical protein